eukprot:gene1856-3602_t
MKQIIFIFLLFLSSILFVSSLNFKVIKRFTAKLIISAQLFSNVLINPTPAIGEETFLSPSKFHEVREKYLKVVKSGNLDELSKVHSKLIDYVFGTITTMYYDPTGGNKFEDNLDWRKKLKDIEKRGKFIYPQQSITQNEIRKLIKGLDDDYAKYTPPEEFIPSANKENSQEEASIGIQLQAYGTGKNNKFEGAKVLAVYPGSSAERSGLRVGDLIVEVGRNNIRNIYTIPSFRLPVWISSAFASTISSTYEMKTVQERFEEHVKSLLEGESGSSVRLGINPRQSSYSILHTNRPHMNANNDNLYSNNLYHVTLKRDFILNSNLHVNKPTFQVEEIRYPFLPTDNKIVYIRMQSFSPAMTENLISTLKKKSLMEDCSLLLLDLRNNFGGVIQDAMLDASLFLDIYRVCCAIPSHQVIMNVVSVILTDCLFVYLFGLVWSGRGMGIHDVDEWMEDPRLQRGLVSSSMPVGVLVNEGTASSAEVFSAALRDNGRATLIGTSTYGKGMIQHLFPLPDGGVLKLTTGEYLTPKKNHVVRNIGIRPDILCSDQPSQYVDGDECVRIAWEMMLVFAYLKPTAHDISQEILP